AALVYAILAGNASFALAALLVAVVGLSVYTYLPIRAAFFPPINEGEPTNWQALWAVLTRQQYGKPSIFDNPTQAPGVGNTGHTVALYWAQLVNYAQYFSWQFAHDWSDRVQRVLAVVFAFLGIAGAMRHWRADRHGDRHDVPRLHVHVRARVLSQFQVRLLPAQRAAAGSARGAPARLLLHGVV